MKLKKWRKFEKFLKKEGITKKYFRNLYKKNTGGLGLTGLNQPHEYITDAFVWSDTKEGFGYWGAFDIKWREHLTK